MRVVKVLSLVTIFLFYASFACAQEPKDVQNLQSGVFGVKWGAPLTSEFTKRNAVEKGFYTRAGSSGIEYSFSPINQFCIASKKITQGEAIALVKQFTGRYGTPTVDTSAISRVGKIYGWTLSELAPFDFDGEIHPTDVGITVTTGGSEMKPLLMIMNGEIFKWGVFKKTRSGR
jgi:hypothetical protein